MPTPKRTSAKGRPASPVATPRAFTVAQAGAIAGLTVAQVNQFMDRDLACNGLEQFGIVLLGSGQRHVSLNGLVALRVVADMLAFTPEIRRDIVAFAVSAPNESTYKVNSSDSITAHLTSSRNVVALGLEAFRRAEAAVRADDKIMGGEPCLVGTRTTVHTIASLAEAAGAGEVKAAYDWISDAEIEAAVIYARAHPRRGRPRTAGRVLADTGRRKRTTRSKILE